MKSSWILVCLALNLATTNATFEEALSGDDSDYERKVRLVRRDWSFGNFKTDYVDLFSSER
jgi:hypothetical protein